MKIKEEEYFNKEKRRYRIYEYLLNKYFELKKLDKNNKNLLLSYYILHNMDKFDRNGDNFSIKKKDHFYYVIMNDLENLKLQYEKNKYILSQKDNAQHTLLHLSVYGEYYSITEFLLEKGINYDEPDWYHQTALFHASGDIKQLLKKFGAREISYNSDDIPKGININIQDKDKIYLISKNLSHFITKEEIIKNNKDIIGRRLIRNTKYRSNCSYKPAKSWIPVYHGTKYVSMEQILDYGLHNYGEPSYGHIKLGITINNVKNWANSIFVSPSIFYASRYSEIINSEGEDWYIIIEAFVDPQAFNAYKSTIYKYDYKIGEPKELEYRCTGYTGSRDHPHVYDEKGIYTNSLLFVKKSYLDNAKNYSYQIIFDDGLKKIMKEIILSQTCHCVFCESITDNF